MSLEKSWPIGDKARINQRCCVSSGGEIVVTGLSGLIGVLVVAGGDGAGGRGAASYAFVGRGSSCG